MADARSLMPVVAAAMTDAAGRVLLQRRPPGKAHGGESPEAALARELWEELAITVDPTALVPVMFASAVLGERHLLLLLYRVGAWRGEPRPLAATALRWLAPADMAALPLPTDDRPLVAALGG